MAVAGSKARMHRFEQRWVLNEGVEFQGNGAGEHTSTGACRNGKA